MSIAEGIQLNIQNEKGQAKDNFVGDLLLPVSIETHSESN